MRYITRKEWGAEAPQRSEPRLTKPVHDIFIHHGEGDGDGHDHDTADDAAQQAKLVRGYQHYHMHVKTPPAHHYRNIAYTELVGLNGDQYEGTGYGIVGTHTLNWNEKSYGICAIGDFHKPLDKGGNAVTSELIEGFASSIVRGVKAGHIADDFECHPHSSVVQTSCPGDRLRPYVAVIQRRAKVLLHMSDTHTPPPIKEWYAIIIRRKTGAPIAHAATLDQYLSQARQIGASQGDYYVQFHVPKTS